MPPTASNDIRKTKICPGRSLSVRPPLLLLNGTMSVTADLSPLAHSTSGLCTEFLDEMREVRERTSKAACYLMKKCGDTGSVAICVSCPVPSKGVSLIAGGGSVFVTIPLPTLRRLENVHTEQRWMSFHDYQLQLLL